MTADRPEGADPTFAAVILAGGSGQRFWPLSRELSPKQLLSIFGTESLIAQAVHRVLPYVGPGPGGVRIVTGERLFDELRNHLDAQEDTRLRKVTYLVEPMPRNTAPATLPDSISATAASARATTEESPTPFNAGLEATAGAAASAGEAAPAPITRAAPFKTVRRPIAGTSFAMLPVRASCDIFCSL